MPAVTSITVSSAGNSVTVVFDAAATYGAGAITFSGAPRIGMTQALATDLETSYRRQFTTSGAPTSGNGTTSHTYDIQDGFVVWNGETLNADVPAGFNTGGQLQSGLEVTNNAAKSGTSDGAPPLSMCLTNLRWYDDTALMVKVVAEGLAGEGDGVESVTVTAGDQTHTATELTEYTTPSGGKWRAYQCGPFDLSTLAAPDVDFTATAVSNCGLGSRSVTVTVRNGNQNATGAPPHQHFYIAGETGVDTNNGLTAGTAVKTIGAAINKARLTAGLGLATFHYIEAGKYAARDGDAGVNFNGLVKHQADVPGVYVWGTRVAGINPRGNAAWWTSSDPEAHQINVLLVGQDAQTELTQLVAWSYADRGCKFTQAHEGLPDGVTVNASFGVSYPLSGNSKYFFEGARVEKVVTFGQVAPSVDGRDTHAWHMEFNDITADPHDNFRTVVNSKVTNRGKGIPVFNVSYTGAGTATIRRTGLAADQGGNKELILAVDGTDVLTMNLTNTAYDTNAKVAAAIDALTDWSAATEALHARYASVDMFPFFPVTITSTPTQFCARSGIHSDLYQIWSSVPQGVFIDGITGTPAQRPGEGGGSIGEQTWWLDHAGPLNLIWLVMRNIVEPHFLNGNVPIPRCGFHGQIKNAVVILNTIPDSRVGLVYQGGSTSNSNFNPSNFTFAYNVCFAVQDELGGSASDIDLFNNHFAVNNASQQVLGEASTVGTIAPMLTTYVDSTNLDVTPTSAVLQDRLAMPGVPDWEGNARGALGALGAAEQSDIVVLPAAPNFGVASATASVNEGQATVGTWTATGDGVTYSLRGTGSSIFTVNASGVVSFRELPDYETDPHTYDIVLVATDSYDQTDELPITVNLVNSAEAEVNFLSSKEGYHFYTSGSRADVTSGEVSALAIPGRPSLVSSGGPTVVDGALVFDGANDKFEVPALEKLAASITPTQFIQLPDASGGAVGEGFTCTGLAPGPNGTWFAGNDGRTQEGDSSPYLSSIVQLSSDFTTKLAEVTTASLGLTPAGSVQGVAYLEDLGLVAFAFLGDLKVHFISADDLSYVGVMPGTAITGLNGLAYDPTADAMICLTTDGVATWRGRATGTVIKTAQLTANADQIHYDTAKDWLWYTTGGNGTDGKVCIRDANNLNYDLAVYTIQGAKAIEGVAVRDGKLWLLNDQYYHPTAPIQNSAIECPLPTPYEWAHGSSTAQIFAVMRVPTSPSATAPMVMLGDSLQSSSGHVGLWTPNMTSIQLLANRIAATWTVPSMATELLVYGHIDLDTDTAELWVNGVSLGVQPMTGTGTTTPDIVRPGAPSLGWQSTPRWFRGEIRAVGATLDALDLRQQVEGFMAHDVDRAALLPADHPYKDEAPSDVVVDPEEPVDPPSIEGEHQLLSYHLSTPLSLPLRSVL